MPIYGRILVEAMQGVNDRRDYLGASKATFYKYNEGVKTSIGTNPSYDALDDTDIVPEVFVDIQNAIVSVATAQNIGTNLLTEGTTTARYVQSDKSAWTKADLLTAAFGETDWTATVADDKEVIAGAAEELLLALDEITFMECEMTKHKESDSDSDGLEKLGTNNPTANSAVTFTTADGVAAAKADTLMKFSGAWSGNKSYLHRFVHDSFTSNYQIRQQYFVLDTDFGGDSRFTSLDELDFSFQAQAVKSLDPNHQATGLTIEHTFHTDWGTLNNSDWDFSGTTINQETFTQAQIRAGGTRTFSATAGEISAHINTDGASYMSVREDPDADQFGAYYNPSATPGHLVAVGTRLKFYITCNFTPN